MRGLMMDRPLLTTQLIEFAADQHAATEIVSRTSEGPIHRYTYAESWRRIQRLAHALKELGIKPGDRIATLAWNNFRHFELYYAIQGIGAVCHTINPRLFPDQLVYIVNHAKDRFLFIDLTFVPLVEGLAARFEHLEGTVMLTDEAHMPTANLKNVLCYETLLEGQPESFDFPEFEESTAAGLCYTSGTTGNPKGVLYSHRAIVLHTFAIATASGLGLSCNDTVMPVVPLFHVNAWGLPFLCAMIGAKLVMPGPKLDGASLYELLEAEQVTITAGVPTLWFGLLAHVREGKKSFTSLKKLIVGGSAAPRAMIEAFELDYGVTVNHAWGMTEMTPVGTTGVAKRGDQDRPKSEQIDLKQKQGHRLFGVDLKIVDDTGKRLPHDGKAFGNLYTRGPWITSGYFEDAAANEGVFDSEGWFRTGDVATIDPDGWVQIVDRSKDVIKSGGEWISSIDLENAAVGHPDIAEAAVIGLPHPKWGERPIVVAVAKKGANPTKEAVLAYLKDKVASWWLPDDVVFVDELPHTATGKLMKTKIRDDFRDHRLPTA